MSTKVLIADDSSVMRLAIRKMLAQENGIQVVGEACTFSETMQMIVDRQPDVLLLDLSLPEACGFPTALVKSQLTLPTLAISLRNDEEAQSQAASYGVIALLDKMALYENLIPAIQRCQSSNLQPSRPRQAPQASGISHFHGAEIHEAEI